MVSLGQTISVLLNVYGYNLPKENVTLMDAVSENIQYWLNKYPNAVLISGGDFNMVLNRFR